MEKWVIPQGSAQRAREQKEKAKEAPKEKVKEHGAKEFGKLTETMFKEIGSGTSRARRS